MSRWGRRQGARLNASDCSELAELASLANWKGSLREVGEKDRK